MGSTKKKITSYDVTRGFGQESSQDDVFTGVGLDPVRDAVSGFRGMSFLNENGSQHHKSGTGFSEQKKLSQWESRNET